MTLDYEIPREWAGDPRESQAYAAGANMALTATEARATRALTARVERVERERDEALSVVETLRRATLLPRGSSPQMILEHLSNVAASYQRNETDIRARLALAEAVVEAAQPYVVWHDGCDHHQDDCPGTDPLCQIVLRLNAAWRALDAAQAKDSDSPVGVAATACEHKRRRCENDHAVCRDCGAINRAVTGVVDWGPPETARQGASTGAVAQCPVWVWLPIANKRCALPLGHTGICDPWAPGEPAPPLMATRADLDDLRRRVEKLEAQCKP